MNENPAPASVRIPIPSAEELFAAYEAWRDHEAFPPDADLDLDDLELFGALVEAAWDAAPSDVAPYFMIAVRAKNRTQTGREEVAQVILHTHGRAIGGGVSIGPRGMKADISFFHTNVSYSDNIVRLDLPSFVGAGQRGAKGAAKDELAATGWKIIPDTRQGSWAPPASVFMNLGLTPKGNHGQFATPFEMRGEAWAAQFMRQNPDVSTEVNRFLDSDKPMPPRRVVNRPRPEPAPAAATEDLEAAVDELPAASRAPARPRTRAGRKPIAQPDLLELHAAAAGDGGAINRLATRYRKYTRGMAYAFLKAWSPSVPASTLAGQADDIAAEVEERVYVGTGRALPAIKGYVVGGKRRRPGRPGFSAGAPATSTGEDRAAQFTTWLGAVTRNVARKHARDEMRAGRVIERREAPTAAQKEALDEVLDFEEREAVARRTREQSADIVEGLLALRAAGKDDDLEVLRLRQKGESYKEIAASLGVSTSAVMSRLYRARRSLEAVSGVELRGLVGELAGDRPLSPADRKEIERLVKEGMSRENATNKVRGGLAGAIPGKRGRPRKTRENPEIFVEGEGWVYFEDAGDILDLLEDGIFDEDGAVQAFEALAGYRPDVL